MKVVFRPEFPEDQRRFQAAYAEISAELTVRFRPEVDEAIAPIKASPSGAGHFVHTGSTVVPELRRRNLHAFPFFVPYGWTGVSPILGSFTCKGAEFVGLLRPY